MVVAGPMIASMASLHFGQPRNRCLLRLLYLHSQWCLSEVYHTVDQILRVLSYMLMMTTLTNYAQSRFSPCLAISAVPGGDVRTTPAPKVGWSAAPIFWVTPRRVPLPSLRPSSAALGCFCSIQVLSLEHSSRVCPSSIHLPHRLACVILSFRCLQLSLVLRIPELVAEYLHFIQLFLLLLPFFSANVCS